VVEEVLSGQFILLYIGVVMHTMYSAVIRFSLVSCVLVGLFAIGGIRPASAQTFPPTPRIQPLPSDGEWKVFVSSIKQNGAWNTIWTFTLLGNAELTIVDLVTGGDRYKVFNGDKLLGETLPGHLGNTESPLRSFITLNPSLALPDPDFGHTTIPLTPGSYRISGISSFVVGGGANRAAIRLVNVTPP
jgi:hypothetical protein